MSLIWELLPNSPQCLNFIYILDIFETKQGIAVLSKFLERSGVFTKNGTDLPRWKPPAIEEPLPTEYDMEDPEED